MACYRKVLVGVQLGELWERSNTWAFFVVRPVRSKRRTARGVEREGGFMSSGKRRQTFSKMTRERAVKEKRERKQEK
ncbi:MAG: hypothetical protein LC808_10195, partial [Actinobacteria bacterium]|nr:hypothetical protein [Actinomycetota bacterium]